MVTDGAMLRLLLSSKRVSITTAFPHTALRNNLTLVNHPTISIPNCRVSNIRTSISLRNEIRRPLPRGSWPRHTRTHTEEEHITTIVEPLECLRCGTGPRRSEGIHTAVVFCVRMTAPGR